jgi:hypothetical protein
MAIETNPVSTIENSLFGMVRFIALLIAALCIAALIYLGYLLVRGFEPTTNVNYDEINIAQSSGGQAGAAATPKYALPPVLKPYLGDGDNKKVLDEWLTGLDEKQRDDFLANMARLVEEGQKKGADGTDIVNAYKDVKLQKLHDKDTNKYVAMIEEGATVGMMVSLLMLVLLVTAILVLLAVERHTRPRATAV